MEFVPYAFCEKVVGILAEPSHMDGLKSPIWQRAVQNEASNRRNFDVFFGYTGEEWNLRIAKSNHFRTISLEELCNGPNKRHHRIVYIGIKHPILIQTLFDQFDPEKNFTMTLNFEELKKAVKRTLPFINMATLRLNRSRDMQPAPLEPFLELLSLYDTSSIREISVSADPLIASYEAILMKKMKTDSMKWISVDQGPEIRISAPLQSALAAFALENPHCGFDLDWKCAVFSREFFTQLFESHVSGTFIGYFNFTLYDLEEFRKSSQVQTGTDLFSCSSFITWNREDGVQVTVRDLDTDAGRRLEIDFNALSA